MTESYQCVVVGAGIEGSCTALYLASQGIKTLLVDQFSLPHARGSSGGESRLIRSAYVQDFFNEMMAEAYRLWKEMEDESKETIIIRGGILCFGKPPHDTLIAAETNMARLNPENLEVLSMEQVQSRYPLFKFSSQNRFFLDKSGGVVKAKTALRTVQKLFELKGGRLFHPFKANKIEFVKNKILIGSDNATFEADKMILCCGPWTNKVLDTLDLNLNLPLQPERVNAFYFREKENVHSLDNNFLPFIEFGGSIYGFPSLEYPGCVKICAHFGVPCDPDERDKVDVGKKDRELVKKFIEEHFITIESEPAIVETCMYTVTPDEIYILDKHPLHDNIVIGAGFSGTGFKIAPLIGKILGKLAIGESIDYDMEPFKISRFTGSS